MDIFFIALLTFVAAAIGTVTGFGTSTVMIPVLVIFLPPIEAIFLVAIIHWFGDLWKIVLFRHGFQWRLITLFGITGLATGFIGAFFSGGANDQSLLRLLGVFLATYAVFLFSFSTFAVSPKSSTALLGGAISGFFAGMFGIGGPIRSMFLSAFHLPKAAYIATIGTIGVMVDSTRIITYLTEGATLPGKFWWGLALFIPVSFIGARFAKRIVDRVPQKRFRHVIAFFLLIMGIKLAVWP